MAGPGHLNQLWRPVSADVNGIKPLEESNRRRTKTRCLAGERRSIGLLLGTTHTAAQF
jgi:hypothetical protein